jgi:Na+-driven multidrug efflux pump
MSPTCSSRLVALTIYTSYHYLSVTATLVSKQHASGDKEGTQDAICQALFVGFFIAMIGTPLMFFFPYKALSAVLPGKVVDTTELPYRNL